MGGNASVNIANFYLFSYELEFLTQLVDTLCADNMPDLHLQTPAFLPKVLPDVVVAQHDLHFPISEQHSCTHPISILSHAVRQRLAWLLIF